MDAAADHIRVLLTDTAVVAGEGLCWSPKTKTITYRQGDEGEDNLWGLLHEAGHAKLQHINFKSDMELLQLEVAAWSVASEIASQLGLIIDPEHVQDCLDTYRDWLHQRSTCPRCGIVSFQETTNRYKCFNCRKTWLVSASRLCRPYRLSSYDMKNRPDAASQAVFQ